MTERDRDISNRVKRGRHTIPDPDVASRRQRLDGSCSAPFAVDSPGTTIPIIVRKSCELY